MKATEECRYCLEGLLRQATGLATEEPELRAKVIKAGLSFLDREFSTDKTSIAVATPLHRLVRDMTGNADPYSGIKEAEWEMAAEVRESLKEDPEGGLKKCLIYAVRGNSIDFFKDLKEIMEGMTGPVEFTIDDSNELERKLNGAANILYLADNAGEEPFDLPLVRLLETFAPVTYVVKKSPVQDDIALSDLEKFGIVDELPRVISTGTDTPGVDMEMASDEFKAEFTAADLVLAKGMGFWETLSELPGRGKVFHLLKAKCRPVADSLGVPLNSYVACLR
ncbi:MAG: ARMT1-like domain-containing protein [Dehalococcoidia bacterium]|nr:ARMT1-like domain-containing protein [Dehalococcoidia bacterium]